MMVEFRTLSTIHWCSVYTVSVNTRRRRYRV